MVTVALPVRDPHVLDRHTIWNYFFDFNLRSDRLFIIIGLVGLVYRPLCKSDELNRPRSAASKPNGLVVLVRTFFQNLKRRPLASVFL